MDYIILKPITEDNIDQVAVDFGWEDSEDMLQDLGHEAEELYDLYVDEIDPILKEARTVDKLPDKVWEKNITLFSVVEDRVYPEAAIALTDGEYAYMDAVEYFEYLI